MQTLLDPGMKEALTRRIRMVRPDSPRRWGKMTPHQMICHLCDGFRAMHGEKSVAKKSNFFSRNVMRWFALHVPLQWPKGIQTLPEVDQQAGGTKPASWDADVADLLQHLERFASLTEAETPQLEHGIFGRMPRWDWMRWAYLHTDHHLRQFGA